MKKEIDSYSCSCSCSFVGGLCVLLSCADNNGAPCPPNSTTNTSTAAPPPWLPLRGLALPSVIAREVATRVGGNPVLVEDEMTGLLVRPGDPDALAKAIIRLVEDPMLARRLGASAYEVVRSRFGVDRMLSRVQAFCERALSGQARLASALSN